MIYLDNAATSYKKPESVCRTVCEATYKNSANAGRGGHDLSVKSGEILYNTRQTIANLINVNNPERIVFCNNTTDALNKGIKGVMANGGHIITTSMEHNSVIRPINALRNNKNITCSIWQAEYDGNLDINKLEKIIRRETKLIVMTHTSNVCGNIYDVEAVSKIAKKHNALFMIDGAQSVGSIDIDASICDILAFPGHKGLLGPMGTGALYVKECVTIKPIIEGGTGSMSESLTQPEFFPDILESGTMNVPCIAGMGKAAEFIMKNGANNIGKYEIELRKNFEENIKNMKNITIYGGHNRCGICAFNIRGKDCVEVSQILNDEYGICVRSGLHCAYFAHKSLGTEKIGCVRVSFGYYNTEKDVEILTDAIYNISKN